MSEINIKYDKKNAIIIILCLVIVVGLLILFLKAKPKDEVKPTATVKESVDTATNKTTVVLPVQNNPQPSVTIVPVSVPQPITQPAADVTGLIGQVKELIEQNRILMQEKLTQREYPDTTQLIDSSGYKVGEFRLKEVVTGNQLASRLKAYTVNTRTITKTIEKTITVPASIKNQWFYGAGVSLDQSGTFRSFDAGISVVNKRGQMLQLGPAVFPGFKIGGRLGFGKRF